MKLPDPETPLKGSKVVIAVIVFCVAFTVAMAVVTYGLGTAWTRLKGAAPVSTHQK